SGSSASGSTAGERASTPGTTPPRRSRRQRALERAGTSFSRQMRLRQVRRRAAQHLDFLFQQAVPFAQFAEFGRLGARGPGLLAGFDAFLAHPVLERSGMDSEVLRDLRD